MKVVTVLFAAVLSANAAADCSSVDWAPVDPDNPEASAAATGERRPGAMDSAERRKAYLDCLRPAPFVQERIPVTLHGVADEFDRKPEEFPARDNALAAN
jgi:hypothetical protein